MDIKEYYKWYPIQEFSDSVYEINKMGQIRNKNTGKILKPQFRSGYPAYTLYINGHIFFRTAHVLVAKQFIPNPENKPIVNHKDENKANPCIDNLEWVSAAENSSYGTAQKRSVRHMEKPINEYYLDGHYIRTWRSAKSILDFLEGVHIKFTIENIENISRKNIDAAKKIVFSNRIFIRDQGNHDDIPGGFIVNTTNRGRSKNLTVFDDYPNVPEEFLYNQEDINRAYVDDLLI